MDHSDIEISSDDQMQSESVPASESTSTSDPGVPSASRTRAHDSDSGSESNTESARSRPRRRKKPRLVTSLTITPEETEATQEESSLMITSEEAVTTQEGTSLATPEEAVTTQELVPEPTDNAIVHPENKDGNEELTKPDNKFEFGHQIFTNMFASTENIEQEVSPGGLRPVVIDGSNVAFAHGNQKEFSEQGILICLDYFQQRGHEVKVFVPQYHQKFFSQDIAKELEGKGILTFTPSRIVDGKRISSYDDRLTLQYATLKRAIVVTNDNYRDLYNEDEKYHEVIKKRLLPYTWPEKNVLMFPPDPLGRNGPAFEKFLVFPGGKVAELQKDGGNHADTTDSTPVSEDEGEEPEEDADVDEESDLDDFRFSDLSELSSSEEDEDEE